jgi:uncharacterized protein (TIGR03118 family)
MHRLLAPRFASRIPSRRIAPGSLVLMLVLFQITAFAQYKVTTLTSNRPGAPWTDPHLVNAWGLTLFPTGPFWVSDNGTGFSTLYNGQGVPQSLVVTIPSATGTGVGSPTGIVANGSPTNFVVSQKGVSGVAAFLFATLDGTISGWSPGVNATNAIIAVNNSSSGTVYTGLAIASDASKIYAADAANNRVNVYDGGFNLVKYFTDPSLPAGFSPYGIRDINGHLYVTFASASGAPGGFLDQFDENGNLVLRFPNSGPMNQPWGIALAPANFGVASNTLLVSNNLPNGKINSFNATTGKFLGLLKHCDGTPVVVDQIWGMAFGQGNSNNGAKNQLFFTAGPNNYANGRFGVIGFVKNCSAGK